MSEAPLRSGRRRARGHLAGAAVLTVAALGVAGPMDAAAQAPDAQVPDACRDVEPWAADLAGRSLSYGALGRLATTWQGAPVSCEGAGDMEFEGRRFGTVTVAFGNGLAFSVWTFPPEGSVTRLTMDVGFDEPEVVTAVAREHAEGFGLRVDWSMPELSEEDGRRVETYWDPAPGLNASVSFVRDRGRLVEVRISAAP